MYEAFYGLTEKPFNLTPDPKYLYLSSKHKEAFAHLLFGIKNRSGFVMVTGEIGTGKTTICRSLLNQLDEDTEIAFVFNPMLNPEELLKKINMEFGLESDAETVLELLDELNVYLLEATAQGKSCVLVIDEAQDLAPSVLEQIRLLSNLETETEKLLQIILIGQPELGEKLALQELRQLNQRITARYHLRQLNEQETLQYIAYRLHVAGARKKVRFARNAIRAVYKHAGGTPRMINAICDRALLIGYTKEAEVITKAIVNRSAKEVRGERFKPPRTARQKQRRWLPSPSLIISLVLVLLLLQFFILPLRQSVQELQPPASPAATTLPDALTAPSAPAPLQPAAPATPGPQAPTLPQEGKAYITALTNVPAEESRKVAANAILRAWNMAQMNRAPEAGTPEAIQAFIAASGLLSEVLTPALDQLLAIDLPAFVLLRIEDQPRWAACVGAAEGALQLTAGPGAPIQLSRSAFLTAYAGKAIIPWRDLAPYWPDLILGRRDEAVAMLKNQLRQLGRLGLENTSADYDFETASAVARLQAETGLKVDGITGKQVRMVINSWMPGSGMPSLRPGGKKPLAHPLAGQEAPPAQPVFQEALTVSEPPIAEPLQAPAPMPEPMPEPAPQTAAPEPQASPEETPPPQSGQQIRVRELPDPIPLPPSTDPPAPDAAPRAVGSVPFSPQAE